MDLRPHHAMCIQKYTGHGYDESFTRHMDRVVARLASEPDTLVRVVFGSDELCTACPNNVSGSCATLAKVEAMDDAAARIMGLRPGEEAAWSELKDRAGRLILAGPEFEKICKNCQWYELCLTTHTDFL